MQASTEEIELIEQTARISTHKALAGLDKVGGKVTDFFKISTHKALAGLDWGWMFTPARAPLFQSTRPSQASTGARSIL